MSFVVYVSFSLSSLEWICICVEGGTGGSFLRLHFSTNEKTGFSLVFFSLLTNSLFDRERNREREREREKNPKKKERNIQWTTRENSIRVEERSQLCVTTTRKDKLRQERSVDTHRHQRTHRTESARLRLSFDHFYIIFGYRNHVSSIDVASTGYGDSISFDASTNIFTKYQSGKEFSLRFQCRLLRQYTSQSICTINHSRRRRCCCCRSDSTTTTSVIFQSFPTLSLFRSSSSISTILSGHLQSIVGFVGIFSCWKTFQEEFSRWKSLRNNIK